MAKLKYLGSLVTDLHSGINLINSSIQFPLVFIPEGNWVQVLSLAKVYFISFAHWSFCHIFSSDGTEQMFLCDDRVVVCFCFENFPHSCSRTRFCP